MNTCPNCNAQITCGCQVRTASNGAKVCSNCLAHYEQKLVDDAKASQTQYYSSNPDENIIS
jgi:transcription elongation factor Elf1